MSHQFIKTSIIFVAGLLVMLGVCEWVMRELTYDFTDNQYRALEKQDTWDTIILGPSTCLHSIDPSVLTGRNAYNFSIEGSTFEYMHMWVQQFFYPTGRRPELTIVCVDTFNLASIGGRDILHDASRWTWRQIIRNMTNDGFENHMIWEHGLRIKQGWKLFAKTSSGYAGQKSENGYLPLYHDMTEGATSPSGNLGNSNQSILPEDTSITHLGELINTVKQHGSEVLLVQTPYYSPYALEDSSLRSAHDIITEIASEHEVQFLDFNVDEYADATNNLSFFESRVHVNVRGAAFTSQVIQEYLQSFFSSSTSL